VNQVNEIFDAFKGFADAVHRADTIQKMERKILSVSAKRCGNCHFWMKSECEPEKKGGHFKSRNSLGCNLFNQESWVKRLEAERRAELKEFISKEATKDE
jgi:hypothetical protein